MNEEKNLVDICLEHNYPSFSYCWLGNHYCGLAHEDHKVRCPYFGEKDHNKRHTCKWYEEIAKKVLDSEITITQINYSINQN